MVNWIEPPALREGDTIAVVAPAGPVPASRLGPGLRLLEKKYKLLIAPDIDRREGFLAGSDERRTTEFNAALRNSDVRAIWAARGGYGCSRIVQHLDAAALQADPISIVGFSDVTVLLCWAASLGVRSIHGPVVTQLGELGGQDVQWVLEMLAGESDGRLLPCDTRGQQAEGRLLGGNLSLLAHLCGTRWAPDYSDAICILEDVGERPYAVDRYLAQLLSQEGESTLSNAVGVLLGDFDRCTEAGDPSQDVIETVVSRVRGAGLPCGVGLPVGHGTRHLAFPFGGIGQLEPGGLRLLG